MRQYIKWFKDVNTIGWMLARRTLLIEVRASRMGIFWPLIYPIAYTALFLALKPVVLSNAYSRIEYALHVFVGLSLWQLWFEGLQTQMRAVKAQRSLLSRADLDTAALFLSGLFVQLVHLIPRLTLAILLSATIGPLDSMWSGFVFVFMSLVVVLNGSVVGFVLQPYSTLWPDIGRLIQSVSLGLMLTGGIFVVLPRGATNLTINIIAINPIGPLVDSARSSLLAHVPYFNFAPWVWLTLTVIALLVQIRLSRKVLPVLLERLGG